MLRLEFVNELIARIATPSHTIEGNEILPGMET